MTPAPMTAAATSKRRRPAEPSDRPADKRRLRKPASPRRISGPLVRRTEQAFAGQAVAPARAVFAAAAAALAPRPASRPWPRPAARPSARPAARAGAEPATIPRPGPAARAAAQPARVAAQPARAAVQPARAAAQPATRPAARPAPSPRALPRPVPRPARSPSDQAALARVLAAVRSILDHALLDRLVRGRAWIPILGVLLAGIVAMQVEVLKMSASIGRSLTYTSALESRNEQLRASVASLAADQRIETLAAEMGMVMPRVDMVGFLSPLASGDLRAAIKNIQTPDAGTFLYQSPGNGQVVTASALAADMTGIGEGGTDAGAGTAPGDLQQSTLTPGSSTTTSGSAGADTSPGTGTSAPANTTTTPATTTSPAGTTTNPPGTTTPSPPAPSPNGGVSVGGPQTQTTPSGG